MDLKCIHCGSGQGYNEQYDAYYCEPCNAWMEEPCTDPDCEFCATRPEKPVVDNKTQNNV